MFLQTNENAPFINIITVILKYHHYPYKTVKNILCVFLQTKFKMQDKWIPPKLRGTPSSVPLFVLLQSFSNYPQEFPSLSIAYPFIHSCVDIYHRFPSISPSLKVMHPFSRLSKNLILYLSCCDICYIKDSESVCC